jgi:WD40 repeat protein
MESLTAKH